MTAPFPRYNPAADLAACHVGDDEWRAVLARWAVGAFHRELDDLAKRSGDRTPEAVLRVLWAVQSLIRELGLDDSRSELLAQTWRCEP